MSEDIVGKLREIVLSQLEIEAQEFQPGASFAEDLGADSLALVELTMAIEEEFDLKVDEEACEKLTTIGDLIAYVRAHARA